MGQDCPAAGVFLAIRSLLVRAGAPRQLKPSTPVESYLLRWPKVFLNEISRLAPGGLPFYWRNDVFTYVFCLGPIAGCGLLFMGQFADVPEITILGVCVCVLGWAGGWLGHKCYAGQPTLPGAQTFRDLTKLIVKQQQLCSRGAESGVVGKALPPVT